jgi:hypothetical protein
MLPIVLAAAFVIGRWWALPLAAAAWPLGVVLLGDCHGACIPEAAALAAANAAAALALRFALDRMVGRRAR